MMPTLVAARTYIDMWREPDRARRRALLDRCFALDGRLVTPARTLAGREAVWATVEAFFADPRGVRARATSEIDAGVAAFRFAAALTLPDGTLVAESLDVGEIDADGRISVLYTFGGRLRELAR